MKIKNNKFEYISLARKLFPINRSLTGNGNRATLKIIKDFIPNLKIHNAASENKFYDWQVPKEWNVTDAYIKIDNKKIIDFKKNNLHLVGYSIPFKGKLQRKELLRHIHTLPKQPNAIPYVTSYYKPYWGFCVSHNDLVNKFKSKYYNVFINSNLKKGSLTYADLIIKGKSNKEILISCNICHPSMANNELSGMLVATSIVQWLKKQKREFTYRIVFIPETLGSIIYIKRNFNILKKNLIAGFVLTCIGDSKEYSYLESRLGNTLADKVALNYLEHEVKKYKKYSFLDRGSDERQYCSVGVDLPVCSLMRSKYNTYKEYHTSLDNLELLSKSSLEDSFNYVKDIIKILENNFFYKTLIKCEPNLTSRNLYPHISSRSTSPFSNKKNNQSRVILDFMSYADGTKDLIDISNKIKVSAIQLIEIKNILLEKNLIKVLR
jgi:aminopeptidase-like protein